MALCRITGIVYLPSGEIAARREVTFVKEPDSVTADYLGAVLPEPIRTRTDNDGSIDLTLITGNYYGFILGRGGHNKYTFRAIVPESATADFADLIAAVDPVEPLPSWLQQVIDARDEARASEVAAGVSAGEAADSADLAAALTAESPQSWAQFADFLDYEDGKVVSFNGALFVRDRSASIADLPTGSGWRPFGTLYPQHYAAVGDGVTDDTAAWGEFQSITGALKAVPAGRYLVDGAIKRFDQGCIGNGEYIDADSAWDQPRGDRERQTILCHHADYNAGSSPVSPVIKTQSKVRFERMVPSGSFKHVAGAYHEVTVDGYYNTQNDTNQNFTTFGAVSKNNMAGLFGTLAMLGYYFNASEEEVPDLNVYGGNKGGCLFLKAEQRQRYATGGYAFGLEIFMLNVANETIDVPYENNDGFSFDQWTTAAKLTVGGTSHPVSSVLFTNAGDTKHGAWNGIVIGGSTFKINNDSKGVPGTIGLSMAGWNTANSYADIGIKFRTANRHLHFREGAKVHSTHTRFMSGDAATGVSIEGPTGAAQYLNFRAGATSAPDGGPVFSTAQVLSTQSQLTLNSHAGEIILSPVGVAGFRANSARFAPVSDNTRALGDSAARFTTVYAATGTINTSDERAKTDVRDITEQERAVAVRLKGMLKAYRFKDAVAEKGDGARIHFGIIAQEVVEAFAEEGLNAHDYALLCHDTWEASPERVDVVRTEKSPAVYDSVLVRPATYKVAEVNGEDTEVMDQEAVYEDGDLITEAVYEETRNVIPAVEAGDRYGIRYDELMAFIICAM